MEMLSGVMTDNFDYKLNVRKGESKNKFIERMKDLDKNQILEELYERQKQRELYAKAYARLSDEKHENYIEWIQTQEMYENLYDHRNNVVKEMVVRYFDDEGYQVSDSLKILGYSVLPNNGLYNKNLICILETGEKQFINAIEAIIIYPYNFVVIEREKK